MDLGFFKRHPYLTGGVIIIGGIVFFSIFAGGGSSGGANTGPTDAQLATNLQLQLATIGAQSQNTKNALALEAHRLDTQAAIELGTQANDIQALIVAAQQALGFAAIDSQNKNTAASLEAVRLNNAAALDAARINAMTIAEGYAVQSEYNNQQYLLNYHAQNVQSDRDAFQYQLNYQQNVQGYDITRALIDKFPVAA